jgi:cystathionine beta-lyase/cystathionine gamma-synthase
MSDSELLKTRGSFTRAVHTGQKANPLTGAVVEPVALCSVYAQEAPGVFKYDYGRSMNPNFYPLEEALAGLEHAQHATVVSSGVAAMTALMIILKAGDHVLIPTDLYGGTYRLFKQVYENYGLRYTQVNMADSDQVEDALKRGAQMLYSESPTNPLLQVYDLRRLPSWPKNTEYALSSTTPSLRQYAKIRSHLDSMWSYAAAPSTSEDTAI